MGDKKYYICSATGQPIKYRDVQGNQNIDNRVQGKGVHESIPFAAV